ncbi:MAG: site-specific DNA-methyltransferase, partial [Muribaculaceae bacterium]|nr:site-specific DNA-methyltransferase [Muribaculaceae bacterium]
MKATDRHKLIERIKTIKGLTDDERSALLGLLREHKTYGLVWEDKPEAVEERLREELPILQEVKDRALISKNPDAPNHILIEGDNLEALTTLAYTHEGKIDVIYIDPPYNTGNKDFIYNDSYVDSEDSYRHSKWLSFMSRRLKIAKKLLSDRGVIFISIDDNEAGALKLLCDDCNYFGSRNFVAQLCWRRRKTQANLAKNFSQVHEYVLVYSKNIETLILNRQKYSKEYVDKTFSNPDNDPKGMYQTGPLARPANSSNREYPLTMPNGRIITAKWSCSEETFAQYVKENRLYIPRGGEGMPRIKIYLSELPGMIPNTWLDGIASNDDAARLITDIFGSITAFNYSKPTELLQHLIYIGSSKDSIVLDFFAGSGTTLHAVMQLNAEDGGKRQCILCTNNENRICENVTYERNKRVINGYTKPNGEHVEGLHDNNLRYYKTDFISRTRTMKNMHKLVALATDMLCIKENLYTEQKRMNGVRTHKQIFRYFDDGKKQMLIIYREEYIEE